MEADPLILHDSGEFGGARDPRVPAGVEIYICGAHLDGRLGL